MKPLRNVPFITSSIMKTYIGCKYAYLEQYFNRDGYNTYRQDDEDSDEAIYLTFGKLIHGCIEKFWKHPNSRTKKFLIDTYKQDVVTYGITDKEYHDLGFEMLENFFNYLLTNAPKRKALHSELGFKVKIGGVPLHGTIDQIFYHGDGIYEIEDYKTSRWIPTQEEVDENIQLTLYDLVFSNDCMKDYWYKGIKPKSIILSLHFLRTGTVIQTERTPYTRVNALNYFRTIYNQMQYLDDRKFKPTLNMFCNYCGCSDTCPLYSSIIEDEYKEPKESDYQNAVEYNIEMLESIGNRIKILESEKAYHYNEIYEYLMQNDMISHKDREYFLSQGGKRYVKVDNAINILKNNGLWEPKDFIKSIPVTKLESMLKDNDEVWDKICTYAIGYSYNKPSISSREKPIINKMPNKRNSKKRKRKGC